VKSHENRRRRDFPAQKRLSNQASFSRRIDWLFDQWLAWLTQISRSHLHVPSLDWRSCIAIGDVRATYVLFSVVTTTQPHRGELSDVREDFNFTTKEAKRIFLKYHRLRDAFRLSTHPTGTQPLHLNLKTWAHRQPDDWSEPGLVSDIPLFIASLVGYWDTCLTKPPLPPKWTGRTIHDSVMSSILAEAPISKHVCLDDLPPGLRRLLQRHLQKRVTRQWRMLERRAFSGNND
jgi:hypothetical protein